MVKNLLKKKKINLIKKFYFFDLGKLIYALIFNKLY